MREQTIRIYDKEDIENLHSMSNEEIANTLGLIKRGWLPQSYVIHGSEGEEYSEDTYDASKLHIALNKAILMFEHLSKNKDI